MADKSGILAGIIRDFQGGALPSDIILKYGVTVSEIRSWAAALSPKSALFRQTNQFLEAARLSIFSPPSTSQIVVATTTSTTTSTSTTSTSTSTTTSTTSTSTSTTTTSAPASANPAEVSMNDGGDIIEFTFDVNVTVVTNTITINVNGDPQTWETADPNGTLIAYSPASPTDPIDDDDVITYTVGGGVWETTVGNVPNTPIVGDPITNTSTVPGGGGGGGLLSSATVEPNGTQMTFVFAEAVYEWNQDWRLTVNGTEYDYGYVADSEGDGTDTLLFTFEDYMPVIRQGDSITLSSDLGEWHTVADDTETPAISGFQVTNNSSQPPALTSARVYRYDNQNDTVYVALELTFSAVVSAGPGDVMVTVNQGTPYAIQLDEFEPNKRFGPIWRDNTQNEQCRFGDVVTITFATGTFVVPQDEDPSIPVDGVTDFYATNEVSEEVGDGDEVLFLDTFTGAAGSVVPHVPDTNPSNNSWVDVFGTAVLDGNGKLITDSVVPVTYGGADAQMSVIDIGDSDCVISCRVHNISGGTPFFGLTVRYVDDQNFFAVGFNYSGDVVAIYEVFNNVLTTRASVATTPQIDTAMTVVLDGDEISVDVNGVIARYTTSNLNTATKHGTHTTGIDVTYDDLKIVPVVTGWQPIDFPDIQAYWQLRSYTAFTATHLDLAAVAEEVDDIADETGNGYRMVAPASGQRGDLALTEYGYKLAMDTNDYYQQNGNAGLTGATAAVFFWAGSVQSLTTRKPLVRVGYSDIYDPNHVGPMTNPYNGVARRFGFFAGGTAFDTDRVLDTQRHVVIVRCRALTGDVASTVDFYVDGGPARTLTVVDGDGNWGITAAAMDTIWLMGFGFQNLGAGELIAAGIAAGATPATDSDINQLGEYLAGLNSTVWKTIVPSNIVYHSSTTTPDVAGLSVYGTGVSDALSGNDIQINGDLGNVTSMSATTNMGGNGKFNIAAEMTGLGSFAVSGQMTIDLGEIHAPNPELMVFLGWCPNVTALPVLPSTLNDLRLRVMAGLATIPTFPTGLKWLTINQNADYLTTIGAWPSGLEKLYVYESTAVSFPGWPSPFPNTMIRLEVSDADNLTTLPGGTLSALPNLTEFSVTGCPNVVIPTLPVSAIDVDISANSLSQAASEAVLANLVSNGALNGVLDVSGNGSLNAAGTAHVATLRSRGWSVSGAPF